MLPIQPIYTNEHGRYRFRANKIVEYLLKAGPFDMNTLAEIDFPAEDREQFAQLIGYSLSGFGELSYVSDQAYEVARSMVNNPDPKETEKDRRIAYLEDLLARVRQEIKPVVSTLFRIHEDDLQA